MSVLHTVSRSPFERRSLEDCLARASEGSGVLLMEDAVYAVARGTAVEAALRTACARVRVFALAPDLAARGIAADAVVDGVTLVDYAGFVDLVAAHRAVHAWL